MRRSRSSMVLIVFAGLLLFAQSNERRPDEKARGRMNVLILADVTSSLNKNESNTVASLAASTIAALPPYSRVHLFPIQKETENPNPIMKETIADDEDARTALNEQRSLYIQRQIDNLYQTVNKPLEIDARTCILNELLFAANYFGRSEFDRDNKVLVVLSDMIEDCGSTPLGQGIHLNKTYVQKEIQAAKKTPYIAGLQNVRIVAVLPSNSQPAHAPGKHPAMKDLEAFWQQVVSGATRAKQTLDWRLGELPEWLGQSSQEHTVAK